MGTLKHKDFQVLFFEAILFYLSAAYLGENLAEDKPSKVFINE